MKKNIVLLFFTLLFFMGYAQQNQKLMNLSGGNCLYYLDNKVYTVIRSHDKVSQTFSSQDIHTDSYGWQSLSKKMEVFKYIPWDPDSAEIQELYDMPFLITGGQYIVFFDSALENNERFAHESQCYFGDAGSVPNVVTDIAPLEFDSNGRLNTEYSLAGGQIIDNTGVQLVSASSFLVEQTKNGTVKYLPNKLNYLSYIFEGKNNFALWFRKIPWVEGVDGEGKGEWLKVTFRHHSKSMVVLNGYVDPFKRYLYKANNRVKTAVIKSLDLKENFEIEYEFEDYVHFSQIDFPKETGKVQLIIKDVYKGSRWNDTAITAVLLNPEEK